MEVHGSSRYGVCPLSFSFFLFIFLVSVSHNVMYKAMSQTQPGTATEVLYTKRAVLLPVEHIVGSHTVPSVVSVSH